MLGKDSFQRFRLSIFATWLCPRHSASRHRNGRASGLRERCASGRGVELPHNDSVSIELCPVRIAALGVSAPDASSRLAQLRIDAKQARERKDQKALLDVELNAAQFLHYSGPATEQLALTYGDIGDSERTYRPFVTWSQWGKPMKTCPSPRSSSH
jgi:hypothetical protein